ncbi:hypothetical protein [Collinsella intestinalis]|uniref:hypothetical protein n=1 Tax=Collinsella intestinalis TaxID=147207 RepID=UPI001958B0A1|nr:hypothetical protein [Collinsella intestinalis]MBM6907471.1 hypothetical protein [Collinsella intestinalis]
MGYQESLIPVNNLAEVSGICRAIEESEELKRLEYLACCCAARARTDLYHGGMFGERKLSDIPEDEMPVVKKGTLFAVVAGARIYQPSGWGFMWIDMIAGMRDPGYPVLVEDIPLEEAHAEAKLHPNAVERARVFMRRSLNMSYNMVMRGERPINLPSELLGSPDQGSTVSLLHDESATFVSL